MPWQEIQNYWLSKLPSYLEYLKNKSPFYEKRLSSITSKDIKTMDDLKKILTKNELRDAQADSEKESLR